MKNKLLIIIGIIMFLGLILTGVIGGAGKKLMDDNEAVKSLYKNAADSVGATYKVTIDYKNMMAIDMLRYKKDSAVANGTSINELEVLYLLWCLHEKSNETNVTVLANQFILETKIVHSSTSTDDKGNTVTITWIEIVYSVKPIDEVCTGLGMSGSDITKVKLYRSGLDTSYPGAPVDPGDPDSDLASKVIAGAHELMNRVPKIRYVFGGPGIDLGYADCSEFTSYVFLNYASMHIGATTFDQITQGTEISSISDLKEGDLVLFQGTYAVSGPSHVGIYISGGNFIHLHGADYIGTIGISNLSEAYWQEHFMEGRRVLPTTDVDSISQEAFIEKVLPESEITYKTGKIFPSVTLAQAIIESGWGKNELPQKSNNLFGIKADSSWKGEIIEMPTGEYFGGVRVIVMANFRVYPSYDESILDHEKFLVENSRYAENGVFTSVDYIAQAYALGRAGYATNPDYPTLLINMVRQYKLDQYDK